MAQAEYLGLHEVELSDIPTVGGKNASLGETIQNLGKLGVQVPGGFVVTVASYEAFIAHNVLDQKIRDIVAGWTWTTWRTSRRTGLAVRTSIKNGKFPEEIWKGIMARCDEMSQKYGQEATDVAVRSSATAKTCPMHPSPGSRRPTSTSAGTRSSSAPCATALPRSSPTVPSCTAKAWATTIFRWASAWASRKWCAPTWAAAAWPSA
ncbi:MAG: hypothetical protein IPO60_11770 [Flavobacteriales bacterium]|nr:hypothetical protein [Flavobacteriales bacterium]